MLRQADEGVAEVTCKQRLVTRRSKADIGRLGLGVKVSDLSIAKGAMEGA